MPSLKDSLVNTSGYALLPAKPPVMAIIPANAAPSPNLRCPLPAFNSDPDTLRQFDDQSTGPKNRVWPLPQQTGSSITTVQTVSKVAVASSSSSSSSSSSTNLTAATATLMTGLLVSGAPFQSSLVMSESFQLLSIGVTVPCEVRLYGTSAAQATDVYRATGAPVPPEISQNIITCVTFDTFPYNFGWQNRCGSNQSSPQTTAIYVSVFNTVPSNETAATVTIQFLPLET